MHFSKHFDNLETVSQKPRFFESLEPTRIRIQIFYVQLGSAFAVGRNVKYLSSKISWHSPLTWYLYLWINSVQESSVKRFSVTAMLSTRFTTICAMFLNSKKLVCHVPEQQKACVPYSWTAKSLCAMFLNSKKLVCHVPEQQKLVCHVPEQQKACAPCSWTAKSLCAMFLNSKKLVRHVPEQQKLVRHVPEQQKTCAPCSWTAKSLCVPCSCTAKSWEKV